MPSPLDEEFDALPDAPPPAAKTPDEEFDALPDAAPAKPAEPPGMLDSAADLAKLPQRAGGLGKVLTGDVRGGLEDAGRQATSAALGFANVGTFGLADEISGAGKAYIKALNERDFDVAKNYRQGRDEYRELDKAAETQEPGAHMLGSAGAIIPAMGVGAAKGVAQAVAKPGFFGSVAKNAPTLAKQGAGMGAAQGFGSSEAEDASGIVLDTAMGAAGGGLMGGALGVGGSALGAVTPWLKKLAEKTGVMAIVGNGHLAARRSLARRGIGGDLVKFAQDEGVLTPLSQPGGREAAAEVVAEKYGQKVGEMLKWADQQAAPMVNGRNLAAIVDREVIAPLRNKPVWGGGGARPPGGHAGHDMTPLGQLEAQNERLKSVGDLTFEEANKLKRSYDDFLDHTKEMSPLNEKLKQIRRVINQDIEAKLDAIAGSINPAKQGEFQAAKRGYGLAEELRDLSKERVLQLDNNKKLGLTNWLAIMSGIGAFGGGAAGHSVEGAIGGAAVGLGKHLLEKYGPAVTSGAARRLSEGALGGLERPLLREGVELAVPQSAPPQRIWIEALPQLVQASPDQLGRYGPYFAQVLEKSGPEGLSALDYALTKSDPEYARMKAEKMAQTQR